MMAMVSVAMARKFSHAHILSVPRRHRISISLSQPSVAAKPRQQNNQIYAAVYQLKVTGARGP
jgi:hypothetical protein